MKFREKKVIIPIRKTTARLHGVVSHSDTENFMPT